MEKKSVMWRNFKFLYMTDVEKSEISPHVEEFQIYEIAGSPASSLLLLPCLSSRPDKLVAACQLTVVSDGQRGTHTLRSVGYFASFELETTVMYTVTSLQLQITLIQQDDA